MSGSAGVVVIGGGVIGASVAYHPAVRGVREVVVLDRAAGPGAGSTGRATGGFRVQFASAIEVRLSLLAREKLRRFADETGGDCGYVPAGYLWVAETAAELTALRDALAVQRANGVDDARELGADEIARVNPALRRLPVTVEDLQRADEAVARAVRAAGEGLAPQRRVHARDLVRAELARIVDAVRALHRERVA